MMDRDYPEMSLRNVTKRGPSLAPPPHKRKGDRARQRRQERADDRRTD